MGAGFGVAESMVEEDEGSTINLPELKQVSCSMVVIREKSEWNVFPPVNHENLQVLSSLSKGGEDEEERTSSDLLSSPSNSSITSCSSTSSFAPSEDGEEAGPVEKEPSDTTMEVRYAVNVSGWWRIWFGILRSKMREIVGWPLGCRNTARARTFWSFAPAAATVLWLLYWRFWLWRWWSRRQRAEERLGHLVKEKDQRIAQLLNQITQMNELLISRHRA